MVEEIKMVEEAGCELLHLDVMDGHFVPNITFGPVIIKGMRKVTKLPLDAHLMIEYPERWVERFIDAGVDWISFHIEATAVPQKVIELVKKNKKKVGVAINPGTPVKNIEQLLDLVDFVVVMTVNPGFGGQKFIKEPLKKVEFLSKRIPVEVDGGVKLDTLGEVVKAGAQIIVSGSGIFCTEDPAATVRKFKDIIYNVTTL
jgi:ribulose-phosphate 3-epimerase